MSATFDIGTYRHILENDIGIEVDPQELERAEQLTLEDLGLDSLAAIEIQSIVKYQFGVDLPDEMSGMTGDEVVRRVQRALSEQVA